MELQLIRSATVRLNFGNHIFLIDPYLADRFGGLSYAGISRSPLVALPFPVSKILAGVDTVIVSHMHSDHFDPAAQSAISKGMPLICQAEDEPEIMKLGFENVHPISQKLLWRGIEIQRVNGKHGSGAVLDEMGTVSGFLFEAPDEPTVYWAGDTILCDEVMEILAEKQPKVVITHSCGAVWGEGVKILMDDEQTIKVCRLSPDSIVITTHMDSVDHATVSRKMLREYARNSGIQDEQLLIPEDGENISASS
jgi:L-ascorbate metabolism protein UlaG (beta-lactamase superfamily)